MEAIEMPIVPTEPIHYTRDKGVVPISQKCVLTLEEAAQYSNIGIHKLREISDNENCKFVLWNGKKRLIKRKKLEEYLDNCYSI